jgi:hypothetical protein
LDEIYLSFWAGYKNYSLGLIHVAMRHGWWDVVVRGAVENGVHLQGGWKEDVRYADGFSFYLKGSWEELIRYANEGVHKEFRNYIARMNKEVKGSEDALSELNEGGNGEVETEEEIIWNASIRDSFLYSAVQFGYIEIVRELHKTEYYDVWDDDSCFDNYSILGGHLAMVQLVVGEFNKGRFSYDAYEFAAAIGYLDIFKYLTELGVQPVTRKVAHVAVKYRSAEVAQYILDKWPDTYGKWITEEYDAAANATAE